MEFLYNAAEENSEKRFKRIERKINHRGWRAVHNLIAHPMLEICRPLGLRLHEYTAKKMYGSDSEEYTTDWTGVQG